MCHLRASGAWTARAYEHRIRTVSTPSSFERRTSLLVGILGVAGSFAFAGATTDFVVTPVSSTVVDLTPGVVVITTIQLLGTLSELVAFIVALLATVMILRVRPLLATKSAAEPVTGSV